MLEGCALQPGGGVVVGVVGGELVLNKGRELPHRRSFCHKAVGSSASLAFPSIWKQKKKKLSTRAKREFSCFKLFLKDGTPADE